MCNNNWMSSSAVLTVLWLHTHWTHLQSSFIQSQIRLWIRTRRLVALSEKCLAHKALCMRQSEESNGIADRVCDLRSVLTEAPLSSVSSALSLQLSAAPAPPTPLIHPNHQQHWVRKSLSGTMLNYQRSRQPSSRHSTCKPTAARIVTSVELMSIGIRCTAVNHVGATCNGHRCSWP